MFHPWPSFLFLITVLLSGFAALADEVIPPKPDEFFNDYAHVTSPATATRLNNALREFERQTSSQIVVAIYPTMQSDSSLEDYTVRVYRAWKVGLKGKDNGAVLFVFVKEHKLRIATGYGLEGALPDIICKQILDNEIAPHFKRGDFDGGLSAGIRAMMAAAKGEYKGTGRTVGDLVGRGISPSDAKLLAWLIVIVVMIVAVLLRNKGGGGGGGGGGSGWWIAANVLSSIASSGRGGGWSSGGGGGWSGGDSGGGGDSGFSGGGGSTGGGGASGDW